MYVIHLYIYIYMYIYIYIYTYIHISFPSDAGVCACERAKRTTYFFRNGAVAKKAKRKAGNIIKQAQHQNGETAKREIENGRNRRDDHAKVWGG